MSEQKIIDRDTYRAIKKMSREELQAFLMRYANGLLEKDGKPVLLLVDKEASGWTDQIMAEAARILVQQELRSVMAELPRGHQLSDIVFTDKPLPRTVTGKVKRWGLRLT